MSYMFWPVVLVQNFFLLFSGFTLLVLAGDKLVETSAEIARRLKIPASVIAVTLIAAGTSAPELVTSFMAAYRDSSEISIGNVIGSNVLNILAVGGLSLFLHPQGQVRTSFFSWPLLIVFTFLFFILLNDFHFSQVDGLVLLGSFIAFLVISFMQNREEQNEEIDPAQISKSTLRLTLFCIASFIGLIFGAELALISGVELGKMAGLSERVIAITIISLGTSLPELATSLAAAFRGHNDMAIANILGSNIFNTLAIPGITASFFSLQASEELLNFDTFVMIAASFLIGLIYIVRKPQLVRVLGFLFFLSYSFYAYRLIFI